MLIEKKVVPLIGLRSPDVFQRTFQVIGIIGYNCRGCLVRGWILLAHCVLILEAHSKQCRNGVGLPRPDANRASGNFVLISARPDTSSDRGHPRPAERNVVATSGRPCRKGIPRVLAFPQVL